uniref:Sphingosine kinase n=1 Tax=Rhipicephalus appendiculatus TaxID=34631 RepID=A0A131YGF2_RHIAP
MAIDDWCSKWNMVLNSDKCSVTRYGAETPRHFFLYPSGSPVLQVDNYKYLGITLSSNLTWTQHITDVLHESASYIMVFKNEVKRSSF